MRRGSISPSVVTLGIVLRSAEQLGQAGIVHCIERESTTILQELLWQKRRGTWFFEDEHSDLAGAAIDGLDMARGSFALEGSSALVGIARQCLMQAVFPALAGTACSDPKTRSKAVRDQTLQRQHSLGLFFSRE
eukprot:CAMPEP_0195030402 /NCGR_PEP_ID=MMETSP0326_2-20130528/58827_1 /TAXON_ID=2866 ORGANISM="Crypthecodinium cohnii, Strain Seligo" /NCGR_SAMPLE_ID=MMETSP0326_2 /ASSEMBLY_ACC=CAM_ASM_000348 /LENGTH=133 /DNA_ID=CAMNT_0040053689 /DNA_START=98 /DNA_END=496 /DNA_ORIENTATION=-